MQFAQYQVIFRRGQVSTLRPEISMSRQPEIIETDMRRLRRMLDRVLTADRRTSLLSGKPATDANTGSAPTRILDVACGACDEANTLADYFAKWKGKGEDQGASTAADVEASVELTGIDVRAREVADAQRRFSPSGSTADRAFEFLNGDATKLDQHRELGEDFDVVFFRHQNLWNGRRTWEEIFDKALDKLAEENGRLIITSYFDREHRMALDAIQRLGGELISTEQNSESRKLRTAGKSIDRHVAVFRKRRAD